MCLHLTLAPTRYLCTVGNCGCSPQSRSSSVNARAPLNGFSLADCLMQLCSSPWCRRSSSTSPPGTGRPAGGGRAPGARRRAAGGRFFGRAVAGAGAVGRAVERSAVSMGARARAPGGGRAGGASVGRAPGGRSAGRGAGRRRWRAARRAGGRWPTGGGRRAARRVGRRQARRWPASARAACGAPGERAAARPKGHVVSRHVSRSRRRLWSMGGSPFSRSIVGSERGRAGGGPVGRPAGRGDRGPQTKVGNRRPVRT